MPITVVLAVGLDQALLESQQATLRSAGYFISSASSPSAALKQFETGDYDLLLMAQSLPAASRERLTMMIRATGSRVPVACVAETSSYFDALEGVAAEIGIRGVARTITDVVAIRKKPVARIAPRNSERLRRTAG